MWTLYIALLHLLKINPETGANSANLVLAFGVIFQSLKILEKYFDTTVLGKIILSLFLVLNGTFIVWTTGGLESMLFTFLIMWGLKTTLDVNTGIRWGVKNGLIWGLCILTRPEGAVLAAIAGIWKFTDYLLMKDKKTFEFKSILLSGLIMGTIFLSHNIFRIIYYGSILPNTWYAKIYEIPLDFRISHGLYYFSSFIFNYNLQYLLLFIPAAFLSENRKWKPFFPLTAAVLFLTGNIVVSGGDFMAMHRLFLPALPIAGILLVHSIITIQKNLTHKYSGHLVTITLGCILLLSDAYGSFTVLKKGIFFEKTQYRMESVAGMVHFVRDREIAGKKLKRLLEITNQKNLKIAVGGAGAISYFLESSYIIDSFGLNDPVTARKKVKPGKFYKAGHLKQASWKYLKSKNPDILCSPGIATIGEKPPSVKYARRVLQYWRHYKYFCLAEKYSSTDTGRRRNYYCCIIRDDVAPEIKRIKPL
ncbi:MAG: hypothetical protein JXR95_06110 [Deltaproteobacteria bacterium]|nr:hypothetical protein [Deltaproteobacteria bacterium]